MVAQGNLVAAQFLGLAVEVPPAHLGTEVAGGLVGGIGHGENIGLKDGDGDIQEAGVALNLLPIDLVIARVHHQIDQLKGYVTVLVKLLHELRQEYGVLAPRDAHGNPVPRLNELVALHRVGEGLPQFLPVLLDDAPLHQLALCQFPAHDVNS